MNITESLHNVTHIFMDTSPVVYYVEKNPHYFAFVKFIFDRIDDGLLKAVMSPITLAECLVMPYRLGLVQLQQNFLDLIIHGRNTIFLPIDHEQSRQAAELRSHYNLTLTDALQVSAALASGCEAILTNDTIFKRVTELRILVLDDLEL